MKYRFFDKNFLLILGIDIILLACALYFSNLVRFDFTIPEEHWVAFKWILPFVLVIKIISFYFLDLYRGMWRFTSIADLLNIIKATTISFFLIICLILFSPARFLGFSRSVFVIDWCFTILLIAGFRLSVRIYFVHQSEEKLRLIHIWKVLSLSNKKRSDSKRLLIIGAGDCGEKIYREIRDNHQLQYDVVGFLDDNSVKFGKKIHGVPVLGYIKDISMVSEKVSADEALIAIPSANAQQIRNIVAKCRESDIKFKTIPGMGELIDGKVTINAIREVDYRDLLGREVIKLDEEGIGGYLKGQSVLVTGAGGSIGSELCRQICRFQPNQIILLERAESPLCEIELELKKNHNEINVVPLLADIQDNYQLKKAFETFKPQTVFHAAAYKHVPMLESQPWKAIENNIQGTINVATVANKFNVDRFVFVSTDKAVRPANVMGASKRVAEMLVRNQNGCGVQNTRFMIVRFGNVVGSNGSVVPLFKKQIKKGGPVTVTHPDVTRFFMTIPEACQLILQAGAMGHGGEIFLLDMGTPIKIDDMARDLVRLSGFEPDVDIKIEYIGLRPGEKLHEELIVEGEDVLPTAHKKIMVLKGIECNLEVLNGKIDDLSILAKEHGEEKIKQKLQEIVPDYSPEIHEKRYRGTW